MAAKTYTVDCAVGVFESLGGADLAPGQTGRAVWDACAGFNESAALAAAATNPAALKIPVLEVGRGGREGGRVVNRTQRKGARRRREGGGHNCATSGCRTPART